MTENDKLIQSGVIDTLAAKNMELARAKFLADEIQLLEEKKARDKGLVINYLANKFPLATEAEGIPQISDKEFPLILTRAKSYYLRKLGFASLMVLPTATASITSLVIAVTKGVMTAPDPNGFLYFTFGLIFAGGFGTLALWQIACRVGKYWKILTRGK